MDDYDWQPPQELQGPALPDMWYSAERLREGEAARRLNKIGETDGNSKVH